MPHLSPPTLTESETRAILRATAGHPRDHLIYSLALGTGLRLAEIVGLNVGDALAPEGTPRSRVRMRPEIAKGGRSGDIFLPDALVPKLRKFWAYKRVRGEGFGPEDPLFCSQCRVRISKRRVQFAWRQWQQKAGFDRLYSFHRHPAHCGDERLPGIEGLVPGAAVCAARVAADDDRLHAPERPGDVRESEGVNLLAT